MSDTPRSPWTWVPTLYFAEGVPYILVNTVSVILYKRLGVENAAIAFWTSLLYLPWVVKMLWGPLVDSHATKRSWILATQLALASCLALIAASISLPAFFAVSLAAFTVAAFVSATHDIAADGYYLHALDAREQAYFVGVRTMFYRAAMIFGSGLLVTFAGSLEGGAGGIARAWTTAFALAAAIYAGLWLYHRAALPRPPTDVRRDPAAARAAGADWARVFATWLRQSRVGVVIAFILLYRLGESMLLKLASPFMLDERAAGGLGFTTQQVGVAYGTVGLGCLILGGIAGGWLIARYGLRRLLWPLALALNVPHLAYLYMAHAQPGPLVAYPLVAIEQLGYGLGTTAFMVVLMRISRGEHRTSHYAIATGLMALGMMLPGMVSGAIQEAVGYRTFFLIVILAGLPGLLTLPFLPRVVADEE
ncbi:MAG TPA: MFS transporter [Candidatus Krumholzibacteria bacterium]|nr:MFS transporter [Candidatus Krumholzibacteria bacterium]HPD70358.1 MFS transporter [Candidatus Krumholzibacteria bacterium]HRY39942.1 MFS transporter [Candidatus Krumholzibacteria bacterium]